MANDTANQRHEVEHLERQIQELSRQTPSDDSAKDLETLRRRLDRLRRQSSTELTSWHRVQLSRHPQRPHVQDFIELIFTDFSPLHGDRRFADDPAMIGGMARFHGEPCMVLGTQKGRDTEQKLFRNFGMPKPEGLPQGVAPDAPGAQVRPPHIHLHRHGGSLPRHWSRRAGTGRSHSSESAGNGLFKPYRFWSPLPVREAAGEPWGSGSETASTCWSMPITR